MGTTAFNPSAPPGVASVIIPARNASATIVACLDALFRELPEANRDVIVVDNGSSDDTVALVRARPVRLMTLPPGFVSQSRNVGAQLAHHPILAFVDSDCVVQDGWFQGMTIALSDVDVGVAGARYLLPDNATWVARAWEAAHHPEMTTALRDVFYVPGGNLALRREVFELVGGFDESIETGEDPDLCRRVAVEGFRVVEASSMRSVHLGEPISLRAVFRRHRWHGRGLRLHYADGHLVPIAIATAAFALTLFAVPFGVLLAAVTRDAFWLAMALAPLAVPSVYACWYGKSAGHMVRLWPVYLAYFVGRAVGLPSALRSGLARARQPKRVIS